MYNTLVFVILCTYIVGMDMYEVKEIVGKGAFAKVYSATCMMSSCNTDILDFDYLDSADLESKLIALKVSHSEQVFVKVSLWELVAPKVSHLELVFVKVSLSEQVALKVSLWGQGQKSELPIYTFIIFYRNIHILEMIPFHNQYV